MLELFTNKVSSAESLRINGRNKEALQAAIEVGKVDPVEIPNLDDQTLVNKMWAWRIWVVALLSESQKTLEGGKSSRLIGEAEKVINKLYHNEVVKEKTLEIKTDPAGNEYQMTAEMLRDEGKCNLYLARLTGNGSFLGLAINYFEQAVKFSEEGSSAGALATMEREAVKRESGQRMDFDKFQDAYYQAIYLSPRAGGNDRAAAAALMYAKESLIAGHLSEARDGFYDFLNYSSKYRSKKQTGLQVAKEVTRPIADRIRRLTL